MPLPLLAVPLLAQIGAGVGTATAVGAGGLAAGALGTGAAATGAAGAGAAGAGLVSAATPAITSAVGGGLSMAPAVGSLPALGSSMPASGLMGSASLVGSPMNFGAVASKFAVPGTPGAIGGTPAAAPAGTSMMGGSNFSMPQWQKLAQMAGNGGQKGYDGIKPPQLNPGARTQFSPFQFSRSNYQFRRPLGY